MSKLALVNGRIVDPANAVDRIGSVWIADGRILAVGDDLAGFEPDRVIDATGLVVCPGFIDLSTRLREPGQTRKATIKSETRAALSAGVTAMCLHPDTQPVIDTPAVAELVKDLAEKSGYSQIFPIAAMTRNLDGIELSSMLALKQAGCIAVGNAQQPVKNLLILRRAMEYAASHDLLVIIRPNDPWLSSNGCAHEGRIATRYGLPSIPSAAETIALAQCLELAELTGCRVHFGQLSCKGSVAKIAEAKAAGLPVSADVAIQYLHLTEDDMRPFDGVYHVLPPLRAEQDKAALRQGLKCGVLDAVCSDHQPHDLDAKLGAFPETEPGMSALETLLPLLLKLVDEGVINLSDGIAALTTKPARILGWNGGALTPGWTADLCVFDPNRTWTVDADHWASQGSNTPYWGQTMTGRVVRTFMAGRQAYALGET